MANANFKLHNVILFIAHIDRFLSAAMTLSKYL